MPTKKEKPTSAVKIRQKKLLKKILETTGKPVSVSQSMKEVGYGKGYAKNPQLLTKTKSWQDLMEEYLPDDLILESHNKLLKKTKVIYSITGDVIETDEIDPNAVSKGVDMAYKIKGKYAPEKVEHTITAVKVINYGDNPTD